MKRRFPILYSVFLLSPSFIYAHVNLSNQQNLIVLKIHLQNLYVFFVENKAKILLKVAVFLVFLFCLLGLVSVSAFQELVTNYVDNALRSNPIKTSICHCVIVLGCLVLLFLLFTSLIQAWVFLPFISTNFLPGYISGISDKIWVPNST